MMEGKILSVPAHIGTVKLRGPTQNMVIQGGDAVETEGAKRRFAGPSCPEACDARGGSNEPRER